MANNPPPEFEKTWEQISDAFQDLLVKVRNRSDFQPSNKSKMLTTFMVHQICTQWAHIVYKRAKAMTEQYLKDGVTDKVIHKKGHQLLQEAHEAWQLHQVVTRVGRLMFSPLDQHYTAKAKADPVQKMMLTCFAVAVFGHIKNDLRKEMLHQVQRERDGQLVQQEHLQSTVELFVEMGLGKMVVHDRELEAPFLQETAEFYRAQAAKWLAEPGGVRVYLTRVEAAVNDEMKRANSYLHATSKDKLMQCLEQQMLTGQRERVLDDTDAGVTALLQSWKVEDLKRMYTLFKNVDKGLLTMCDHVREFIKKEGRQLNHKLAEPQDDKGTPVLDGKAYVDACMDLHDKYTHLFVTAFNDETSFHKSRKDAFSVFLNEKLVRLSKPAAETAGAAAPATASTAPVTISELLSGYCDTILKTEKLTPDELETKSNKLIDLFMHISDKDLFQEVYRRQMSRRLLTYKDVPETETAFIQKLKMKMGGPYTSKLEGMINDKNVSQDTQHKFQEWLTKMQATNTEYKLGHDFAPTVLTSGFWPPFKVDQLNPNAELSKNIAVFDKWYRQANNSRVLKWVHSLGTALLVGRFKKQDKDLMVSTFQACVLLLFNDKDEIKITDMVSELGMDAMECKRAVHNLAFSKFAIIVSTVKKDKKTVQDDDVFKANVDFTSPSRKILIPNVVKHGDASAPVDESRKHIIEAALVRIMKARKELGHQELLTECIKQLRNLFNPDPKMIKKRIEELINRNYLERAGDQNAYRYLA